MQDEPERQQVQRSIRSPPHSQPPSSSIPYLYKWMCKFHVALLAKVGGLKPVVELQQCALRAPYTPTIKSIKLVWGFHKIQALYVSLLLIYCLSTVHLVLSQCAL